jgi:hypothetical protein
VTLTATASSGGLPVQSITYSATGAQTIASTTVQGSTATVTLTTEGVTTLSYFATDQAGNKEPRKTLVVRIDTTPPEAVIQFDATAQDLLVFGKDAGSGVPTGPLAASSVMASSWSPGDAGGDAKPDGNDHGVQLRTYTLTDLAGNMTTLVIKVQVPGPHGDQLRARLLSIQYGSAPAVTFSSNSEEFHWGPGRPASGRRRPPTGCTPRPGWRCERSRRSGHTGSTRTCLGPPGSATARVRIPSSASFLELRTRLGAGFLSSTGKLQQPWQQTARAPIFRQAE